MASCLVPNFLAVMVALEHLEELDKRLKEDGVPFSPEASLHLTEITAAVTELEADRRAVREHLEVETIENSKLRHQIKSMNETMSQEIMADAAAARASNAEEKEQLLKDLDAVSQLQEATVKRNEALSSQNEALYPEREQVKAELEEIVAALNDRLTFKYGLQMHLNQTQDQIEELKCCTAAVEQDKVTQQQNMALEREAFTVKQDHLSREVNQVEGKIQQQEQSVRRGRRKLDRVDKKQETHDQLKIHMANLESNLKMLTASRGQCEKQLEGETQNHQELRQQRETLKKELCELGEAFSVAIQRLKEDIATVEGKIEVGRASRFFNQDSVAQISEIFKRQCDEENEVRAELFHVSEQLRRSKLQLKERIASIFKHNRAIKKMDKQIAKLLEANAINKQMYERNQEKLRGDVDTEKRNVSHFEEEKRRLTTLLEEAKRKQEEPMAKMTFDISSTRRRYQELQQEEAALQRRQPKSVDTDLLMSHVTQCELEYRQKESEHHQEIEQFTAETEIVTRSNEEKQREVEEKEERLKEVEAMWNEEQSRHQRLETLTYKLSKKKTDLKLSTQVLMKRTSSLLEPKEEMKAELKAMRDSYMAVLDKQASELRAAEMSVYDDRVKLEQVSVENSRLHLCVRQMSEGVSRAREDNVRYCQEIHQFRQDIRALSESLEGAKREDFLVTQDCQSSDGILLASMSAMLNCLKTRRQQLESVSTILHQQMSDFSKRLGERTTL